MQRREMIETIGLATTGLLASRTVLASGTKSKNKTHSKISKAASDLVESLGECRETGTACVNHCMQEMAEGNKNMAECNRSVHEMLAMVEATFQLVSYGSQHAKAAAKLCEQVCRECAEACNKHKDHFAHGMHLQCKACGEACLACADHCKKFVG